MTMLHDAIGDIEEMKRLIENGAEVNARDEDGEAPLHYAARCGYTDTAQLLLKKGAEVNARDEIGDTPLHIAALWGRTETEELLKKHGAR